MNIYFLHFIINACLESLINDSKLIHFLVISQKNAVASRNSPSFVAGCLLQSSQLGKAW
jgi:hypothetical protein